MNENKQVKQVIVFRKDLLKGEHAIRKGKFAAQVAHASLSALLTCFEHTTLYNDELKYDYHQLSVIYNTGSILDQWLNGIYTKVVVSVDNEEELLNIYNKALNMNIPAALITDVGKTEFNGVSTNTCVGLGPCWSDDIDSLTKDLKLL